jgi:hypothetical protein
MRASGARYNYFDPAWHPFYQGTDEHTMQSVSKSVTSATIGVAIARGDFKASLDTPVLHYFDAKSVRNVDERKRRMTLRHVLTMTTGLDWDEDVPVRRPAQRLEPHGGHARLGGLRHRSADGARTGLDLRLQQRSDRAARAYLQARNRPGHREVRAAVPVHAARHSTTTTGSAPRSASSTPRADCT